MPSLKSLTLPVSLATLAMLAVVFGSPSKGNQAESKAPIVLDATRGQEIGSRFEGFLSPHQEPDEESATPNGVPKAFLSTAPSKDRQDRVARGHGIIRFTKDLSKAYVDVKVSDLKAEDVVMFHIHCGKPDMLGPILIDFGSASSLQTELRDGNLTVELGNADIAKVSAHAHGLVGSFTSGCPVDPAQPMFGKVKTIAGMEHIARQGELYFNLHTKGQTFFGEMRGQIRPATP